MQAIKGFASYQHNLAFTPALYALRKSISKTVDEPILPYASCQVKVVFNSLMHTDVVT